MKKMKKIFVIVLILVLVISLFACVEPTTPTQPPKEVKLATPQGLVVDINALISWRAVENATSYVLTINGVEYTTESTRYQADKNLNFTVSVVAKGGKGYIDSDPSITKTYESITPSGPVIPDDDVVIAIEGGTQINSLGTLQLTAVVSGTDNTAVNWEITSGKDFATIDNNGLVTAKEVSGDKTIIVKCTSKADEKVSVTKVLNIRAKNELTQAMLDTVAAKSTISYVGFVSIDLFTIGINPKPYKTYSTVVQTAMDGTNWYAQYETDGIKQGLYYKNHEGFASKVGLSFMNDELYEPMLDDDGEKVTWEDAGLYNNFVGLNVSDFTWNEDEWRWVYTGKNNTLMERMIASANPYEFEVKSFSLIIDGGEVIGIYALSEDDYTLATNYKAIHELFVAIDSGETVEVPTIAKYAHEDIHDDLKTALNNMHSLDNYTITSKEIIASVYSSGYNQSGYVETITSDLCHFEPFDIAYDISGREIRKPKENASYGFKKLSDDFYNTYYEKEDGTFSASRAYANTFDAAKPTFAFAPEIFRSYAKDEENGTTTYYVDELMSGVASTFYRGVGNDVALYGIFATTGIISSTSSFTPYVTVKDGYIVEAGFYFYMGAMYGVIELTYSDFNTTTSTEKEVNFETRQVPTKWEELTIIETDEDETEVNALDYLKEFFGNENIAEIMPFFGEVLGDTFGFAMTTYRVAEDKKSHKTITFYYDVPLDIDYTINSSIETVENFLIAKGFEKDKYDNYVKNGICVKPYDQSLDFVIYVWRQ